MRQVIGFYFTKDREHPIYLRSHTMIEDNYVISNGGRSFRVHISSIYPNYPKDVLTNFINHIVDEYGKGLDLIFLNYTLEDILTLISIDRL